MVRSTLSPASLIALLAALVPSRTPAAGFYLYELGSPSVGLASAGYAARASDAETLFTNPAGLTRLGKMELLVGAQALYGDVAFSPNASTTTTGGDGGNALGWLPGGSVFLEAEVAPRLKVGFGALSYFGLGLEYDPGWVGRYYGQKGALVGFSFLPTVAYRLSDQISIGAGLNAMYAILRSDVAVNNVLPTLSDGQLTLKDSAWGFGGNFGLLLEPSPSTRIGLTWLTAVKLGFEATPSWSNLGPGIDAALRAANLLDRSIGLGMTAPNRIMLGVSHDLSPALAVMADVGWEDWSRFGKVEVSVADANASGLTTSIDYQDTWHLALGARLRATEAVALSGGFAYDTSMMKESARTVLTPVGAAYRYALGVEWAVSPAVRLGLDDTFAWGGTLPLDQSRGPLAGTVAGAYGGAFTNMLALNLRWVAR